MKQLLWAGRGLCETKEKKMFEAYAAAAAAAAVATAATRSTKHDRTKTPKPNPTLSPALHDTYGFGLLVLERNVPFGVSAIAMG